jgi:hypothetical protein
MNKYNTDFEKQRNKIQFISSKIQYFDHVATSKRPFNLTTCIRLTFDHARATNFLDQLDEV